MHASHAWAFVAYHARMAERTALAHTIAPVFDKHSRVLVLGTFPSPKSREVGFFYGHPQNRMWRVLAAVTGEEQVPQSVEERTAFLLRNRIAMWDVLARCTIEGASDASIRDAVPNNIQCILDVAPVQQVFTTGVKATALYERYLQPTCGLAPLRLPSTSAANAAWSLPRLIEAYRVLGEYLVD